MSASILPLSTDQARDIYRRYITKDFPPDERKPWAMIQSRLEKNEYRCLGLFEENELRSYAFFALDGQNALLDYFAVLRKYRDKGYGSLFLRSLMNNADFQYVLVEAEDPAAAHDENDRIIRDRRLRFYLRNGLIETGAWAMVYGVAYVLLCFPCLDCSAERAARVYGGIYHSFLPDDLYSKWIRIEPCGENPEKE